MEITALEQRSVLLAGVPARSDARPVATPSRAAGRDADVPPRRERDGRVDALRGLALLMMFVDHIPQNLLNRLTLRNLGFADAAEIFVLLAGFASMLAYGRLMDRAGLLTGINRVARRIGKLYLFQLGLLLISIVLIRWYSNHHPVSPEYLEPELAHGHRNIWRAAFLLALPSNLNILPLYIVLLACFPAIWLLLRRGLVVVLVPSALLWLAANLDPDLNFPNWLDPDGWYFNPIAWQFLFTLGAVFATVAARHGGDIPRHPALTVGAWTYLAFSLLEAFPYDQHGLPSFAPFDIANPGKTPLAPLRLLDVLSIFYLVASSERARRLTATVPGRGLALLGRHSLEVFTLGTFVDLLGKLSFDRFGTGFVMQVAINLVGVSLLFALASFLDRRKRRQRAEARLRHARAAEPEETAARPGIPA